jgi:DHA1 family multidrug resistance protein-like MFS transporter
MFDLIRDAPIGQLIRLAIPNRPLQYPEEAPDFQCPLCYKGTEENDPNATDTETPSKAFPVVQASPQPLPADDTEALPQEVGPFNEKDIDRGGNGRPRPNQTPELDSAENHRPRLGRVCTLKSLQKSCTRAELEGQFLKAMLELDNVSTETVVPERLVCGTVLVDWYNSNDPANPKNWSTAKKSFVSVLI